MKWCENAEICKQRIVMYLPDGEEINGRITGVTPTGSLIRALGDDGETYVGNLWDSLD